MNHQSAPPPAAAKARHHAAVLAAFLLSSCTLTGPLGEDAGGDVATDSGTHVDVVDPDIIPSPATMVVSLHAGYPTYSAGCLLADTRVRCWDGDSLFDHGEGFTDLSGGALSWCGINAEGALVCGSASEASVIAAGPFVRAADGGCALTASGALTCPEHPELDASGPFIDIKGRCVLRDDTRAVECRNIGDGGAVDVQVTEGPFARFCGGFGCFAVREDGSVEGFSGGLTGPFSRFSSFEPLACVVRPEGEVECDGTWSALGSPLSPLPAGRYVDVAVTPGMYNNCAVRDDALVVCWGPRFQGFVPLPFDRDADDVVDIEDNCLEVANPDQADLDEDGVGDACD